MDFFPFWVGVPGPQDAIGILPVLNTQDRAVNGFVKKLPEPLPLDSTKKLPLKALQPTGAG
jgi:hypothetical protein